MEAWTSKDFEDGAEGDDRSVTSGGSRASAGDIAERMRQDARAKLLSMDKQQKIVQIRKCEAAAKEAFLKSQSAGHDDEDSDMNLDAAAVDTNFEDESDEEDRQEREKKDCNDFERNICLIFYDDPPV